MFDFTAHPVHPNLKRYVNMFTIFHINQNDMMRILSPAKTESVMMFHLGNNNTNDRTCSYDLPNNATKGYAFYKNESWFGGMINQPLGMTVSGNVRILCVVLKPFGAYHLLKESATGILNAGYSLDAVGLEKHFTRLADTLRQTESAQKAFQLLENQMLNYFSKLEIPFSIKDMSPVIDYINQRSGVVKIKDLEGKFRISRRWLEKQFAEQVGVSPKEYARIKRFSAVLGEAMMPPSVSRASTTLSWTRLLNDFGYYDHSHLIKDFHDFTGHTPTEYIKSQNPDFANNLFFKSLA